LQHPIHNYTSPGIYDVLLTVTNVCNCPDYYNLCIEVSPNSGLSIYCNNVTCQDRTENYTTDNGCDGYAWTIDGGQIIENGILLPNPYTTVNPSIDVWWDLSGGSPIAVPGFGQVTVSGIGCIDYCEDPVSMNIPIIYGNNIAGGAGIVVCVGDRYTLRAPAWPATDFTWEVLPYTIPAGGGVLTSPSYNSNTAEVLFSAPGYCFVNCEYSNTLTGCNGVLYWKVIVLEPAIVNAPAKICINPASGSIVCTISNPTPITQDVQWVVTSPSGLVLTSTTTGNTISYPNNSFWATPGKYVVSVSSVTDPLLNPYPQFCQTEIIIEAVLPPANASAITGDLLVCAGANYNYQATSNLSDINYNWVVTNAPPNSVTGSGASSLASFQTFPATLSVSTAWSDFPGCNSTTSTSITVNKLEAIPTVVSGSGANPICEDGTGNYSVTIAGGIVPDLYEWSLLDPTKGSIASGQGTNAITINWNHLPGTTASTCGVRCRVFKCGVPHHDDETVNILKSTDILNVTSITVCSGTSNNYTGNCVTTTSAPSQYSWDWGDGTTTPNTSSSYSNTQSHVYTNTTDNVATFNGTLTVISSCNGNSTSMGFTVTVNPQPNAAMSYTGSLVVCQPTLPTFLLFTTVFSLSNTSTVGSPFSYQWQFDQVGAGVQMDVTGATAPSLSVTDVPLNIGIGIGIATALPEHNQGDYYCIVNNTFNCPITVGPLNLQYSNCNPTGGSGTCVPVAPSGISSYSIQLTNCATLSATCSTAGTAGINIFNYYWTLNTPAGASYTTTGTPIQNNSYNYLVDKAGIYNLTLGVDYYSSSGGGAHCYVEQTGQVIVPLVPALKWGITCNFANTGYDVTLTNNSSVYPAGTATTYTWLVDGTPLAATTAVVNVPALSSGAHTIQLIASIGTGVGQTCSTAVQTITIPSFPIASFTVSTTDPLSTSTSLSSCIETPVSFTSTSTPMANIIQHIWTLETSVESWIINPVRVYDPNGYYLPSLIVKDLYGCISAPSQQGISVVDNLFDYATFPPTALPYTNNPQTPCYGVAASTTVQFSGGTPTLYSWYNQAYPVFPLQNSSTFTIPTYVSGLYWVKVADAHGCLKNVNPPLFNITYKSAPIAAISGKKDVCYPDLVALKADCGAATGITYNWTIQPGATTAVGQNLNISLATGTYSITCTTTNSSGCSITSLPFTVTVHANPSPPALSHTILDCDKYDVELSASHH